MVLIADHPIKSLTIAHSAIKEYFATSIKSCGEPLPILVSHWAEQMFLLQEFGKALC
jgi:hypothetical protein